VGRGRSARATGPFGRLSSSLQKRLESNTSAHTICVERVADVDTVKLKSSQGGPQASPTRVCYTRFPRTNQFKGPGCRVCGLQVREHRL
jgi:hypothetical protein